MNEHDLLAEQFETNRPHLRAVAYRMLGSMSASRGGDFDALLAVLDPDVVLRADVGAVPAGASTVLPGARAVAEQAHIFARRLAQYAQPALVNGAVGLVVASQGRPFAVMGFTIRGGRIVEIDILADPARLGQLDLAVLDG